MASNKQTKNDVIEMTVEPAITQAPEIKNPQVKADQEYKVAISRKKELYNLYMAEEKVPVYLSPQYRNELGSKAYISVNGIALYVPVDGQTYHIPKTFADELHRKRINIDDRLLRQEKMADVRSNFEQSIGDIKLF